MDSRKVFDWMLRAASPSQREDGVRVWEDLALSWEDVAPLLASSDEERILAQEDPAGLYPDYEYDLWNGPQASVSWSWASMGAGVGSVTATDQGGRTYIRSRAPSSEGIFPKSLTLDFIVEPSSARRIVWDCVISAIANTEEAVDPDEIDFQFLNDADAYAAADAFAEHPSILRERIESETGRPFPDDPDQRARLIRKSIADLRRG